jgi:hypothetical protein
MANNKPEIEALLQIAIADGKRSGLFALGVSALLVVSLVIGLMIR